MVNGNTVRIYRMPEFGEDRMGSIWAAKIGPDCNDFHCLAAGVSPSDAMIKLALMLERDPRYHLDPMWEPTEGGDE